MFWRRRGQLSYGHFFWSVNHHLIMPYRSWVILLGNWLSDILLGNWWKFQATEIRWPPINGYKYGGFFSPPKYIAVLDGLSTEMNIIYGFILEGLFTSNKLMMAGPSLGGHRVTPLGGWIPMPQRVNLSQVQHSPQPEILWRKGCPKVCSEWPPKG